MPRSGALRITLVSDKGDIRIRDTRRVRHRAPPGEPESPRSLDSTAGVWVELHGVNGAVYRRNLTQLFEPTREVYGGPPDRPFLRVPVTTPIVVDVSVPFDPDDEKNATRLKLVERRVSKVPAAAKGKAAATAQSRKKQATERVHVDVELASLARDAKEGRRHGHV